ncbi:glycosyltransferase family 2 protein [Candidatus Marifrigoribacter sp. Uisw_064]|jgi:GT2 family glycosyltransferase|uniref:glycosyltransferase family 2 protein n=1 Tax=Candidatus Marifrigoribacter sp. Uisw_064 TaxID=3230970 RepID=UPI003D41D986
MRLGIVILNYNSFSDTIKLVEELQQQTVVEDIQIVLVDNESPNNSFKHLKPLEKTFSNVKVLQTGGNLGYAKGNNFGLNYLDKNIKPEYVAILNNDIVLPKNCFEKLIEKYKVLENPAIIAPKQLDIDNNELLPYKINSFLDDCLNLFYIFKLFNKRNALKYKDTSGSKAMKVDLIPGSFMFSSFKTFKQMGFFYPNTFLFVEERFIAVKVKQLNLNNYILLDETYVHAHSKTINTAYNQVGKYKLLYVGWLEFTRVCRSNGKLKAIFLKPLMQFSLLEIRIVETIRQVLRTMF